MKIGLFVRDPTAHICVRRRLLDPLRDCLGHEIRYGCDMFRRHTQQYEPEVLSWADVLVAQRAFPGPDTETLCAAIRDSGKPVVYESDDLLEQSPRLSLRPYLPFIREFQQAADLVTVSTPALADHYSALNANTQVLRNYLNATLWLPHLVNPRQRRSRRVRVGYFGDSDSILDINSLRAVLLRLAEKHAHVDLCFWVGKPNALEHLACASFRAESCTYEEFPAALTSLKLDIGIVPGLPTALNRSRSPVKFFDYALAGAACVASADSPFAGVIKHGQNGFLCSSEEEWFATLDRLVQDTAQRREVALRAQAEVLQNWMLADHAPLWQAQYERLL